MYSTWQKVGKDEKVKLTSWKVKIRWGLKIFATTKEIYLSPGCNPDDAQHDIIVLLTWSPFHLFTGWHLIRRLASFQYRFVQHPHLLIATQKANASEPAGVKMMAGHSICLSLVFGVLYLFINMVHPFPINFDFFYESRVLLMIYHAQQWLSLSFVLFSNLQSSFSQFESDSTQGTTFPTW